MKRLICVVLILFLLIPAAALADADFSGCWVSTETLATGCPSVTFLCLREDHTCFYLIQSFREEEAGPGRTFIGTWDVQDGVVVAKTGNNTTTSLLFNEEFTVGYDPSTLKFYIHTSLMIDGILDNLQNQ